MSAERDKREGIERAARILRDATANNPPGLRLTHEQALSRTREAVVKGERKQENTR